MGGDLTSTELFTLDANALQQRLEAGSLSSVKLATCCLTQIETYDQQRAQLRAIISIEPRERLLARALQLDVERSSGQVRSRLHGIPVLVKDNIATSPNFGLNISVGSLALKDSKPGNSSFVDNKLNEMGAIILAKTNLNEFCGIKCFSGSNGWSAVAGQTQSAYIPFDPKDGEMGHSNPCGSSTGSAVGVSTGYAPIALGTDSIGSLFSPATRAALYTIKPTVGSVDMSGIWPVSSQLDAVGGITKSVIDLAVLTTSLVDPDATKLPTSKGFEEYLSRNFQGLQIGFLDPRVALPTRPCPTDRRNRSSDHKCYPPIFTFAWLLMKSTQTKTIEEVVSSIRNHVEALVIYPVSIPPLSALQRNGNMTLLTAITYEMKSNSAGYLSTANVDNVRSVEDIVKFNEDHASQELPADHPNQDWLLKGSLNPSSKEKYDRDVAYFRRVARDEGIDKLFQENDLNLLAFSADSLAFFVASAAGYPIASMPLGILDYNGRPFGPGLIAKAGREDLMFQFMSAFEATFPQRQIPTLLLKNSDGG